MQWFAKLTKVVDFFKKRYTPVAALVDIAQAVGSLHSRIARFLCNQSFWKLVRWVWHEIRYRLSLSYDPPFNAEDAIKMIASANQGTESTRDRKIYIVAMAALSGSQYGALRKLTCQVCDGVVEISGTVPSFYLKQLAQAAVLRLNPSGAIRNLVKVSDEPAVLMATHCGQNSVPIEDMSRAYTATEKPQAVPVSKTYGVSG